MGYINFDLTNCGILSTLASPGAGIAGTLPGGMPATGGLYLIVNEQNQNRYIGKSGDLVDRFNGRMLTINEFGFAPGDLLGIDAFWGEVSVYNTPVIAPGAFAGPLVPLVNGFRIARNALGAAPIVPNAFVGAAQLNPNYAAHVVTTTIDGALINVEALLIRFWRQCGVGGTITNLNYMGPFTNPTGNELIVQVEWGACGAIPAAHFCITIPANGVF